MKSIVVLIGIATLLAFPAPALHAGCTQQNIAGTWDIYIPFSDAWQYCTVVVKKDGKVASGSKCKDSYGGTETVTGGKFTLSSKCIFTGTIDVKTSSATVTVTIDRGTLGINKDSGVAACHNSQSQYFTLDAVKK